MTAQKIDVYKPTPPPCLCDLRPVLWLETSFPKCLLFFGLPCTTETFDIQRRRKCDIVTNVFAQDVNRLLLVAHKTLFISRKNKLRCLVFLIVGAGDGSAFISKILGIIIKQ